MRGPGIVSICLSLLVVHSAATAAEMEDGRMFDPGIGLKQPSGLAPEQTARLLGFLGDWNVEMTLYPPGAVLSALWGAEIRPR